MARDLITPASAARDALRRALLAALALVALTAAQPASASPRDAGAAAAAQGCTINGSGRADRLAGTTADDVICARGGADRVRGARGSDVLNGGAGGDLLQGKEGSDTVLGGAGNDRAYGGAGADDLRGGRGDDGLGGGLGPDEMSGGPGRDIVYYGQRGRSVRVTIGNGAADGETGERDDVRADVEDVQGGRGNDVLTGNSRANRLLGGGGNDHLRGMRGNDLLMGGAGSDRLDAREAGAGAAGQGGTAFVDRVVCGAGNDTAVVDAGDLVDPDCESVVGRAPAPPGNRAPTGIALSGASVAENQAVGAAAGTLSANDPDPGDTHSFALVPGAGSDDNGSFEIAGTTLRAREMFNYEAKATYSVRIRATDFGTPAGQIVQSFTIRVSNVNEAPTGLTLSNATMAENEPVGTTVGNLTVSDPDAGQQHAFTLVAGPGDTDNARFAIDGSTLETAEILDFEADDSYAIRVRAADDGTPGLGVEQSFTVTVTDTLEPPAADDQSATTDEDSTVTITLSATDPEGDDVASFTTLAPSNGTVGAVGPITCAGPANECTADVVFTPTSNFNGDASFSYTASDGANESAPATVSITVNPVNDAPAATTGNRTTDEDADLDLDLDSLVSDVETADADLTYAIVAAPAHGDVVGTTYTPDADFNGSDSLTYRVTDRGDPDDCAAAPCDAAETSTIETVSITVNPVNDVPDADDASLSVDEDTSLPIDLAALASDLETADANLTYTIGTPPAHGAFVAGTYTPAGDFNGTDSFTYTVTDRGDPDNCAAAPCDGPETSAAGTISITVGAVNDAPVNTLPAGPVLALPNTNTAITGISVADVDAAGDDLEVTLSVTSGTLTVALVPGGVTNITGNGSGEVVLQGSLLALNTTFGAANGVVFNGAASTTLTVATSDLGHNGSGGAETDTDTLAITVNTPPVAADLTPSTSEDTPLTVTLSASDADGDASTFAIGTGPTNGSLGAIGAVSCTGATPNVCTADVVYTPDADFNGTDSFTYTAGDGPNTSAPATVSITVNAVNDAPELENVEPGALAYTENDPATLITAAITVSDADSANFDTGTLTVDYAAGGTADDRLEIQNAGQIAVSGADVTHGGTTIGTVTGGTGTTPLVVTLNANATPAVTEALVRAIAYRNVSDNPSTTARTVRFVLTDGDGGTSAPAARGIAVTAVDDPPVLAAIEAGALGYTENDPATAITSSLTVADPDSNITGATVSISANLASGQDVLGFTDQAGITGTYNAGTGVLTLTGSASPAAYQTALRSVTYRNTSDDPSTLARTITFAVTGGNTQSRDVTVTAVNDAPAADDETFSGAVGNTTLIVNDPSDGAPSVTHPQKTISGDILAGDSDVDGPGPLTVTAGTVSSVDGGSATLEADGDFTYLPPATSCADTSDSFSYTLEDSGSPELTDTGTVTIQFTNCVWYVRNTAAAGGDGTSDGPFDTLAEAEAASGASHTVFVFDGDNTAAGYGGDGYAMDAGERLIGEHEGLQVGGDALHPANPGAHPTLTANNADVIALDDGNEIRGLNLDPQGAGGGIAGTAGDTGGGTIDDVNIVDGGTAGNQAGLELNGTAGTFNVTNLVVNNGATGILLNNAGTTDFGSTTITSSGARGLDATGTDMGTSTFNAITVSGSGNGGVSLSGTTGTTTFGDLSLTTTSGAASAFTLSNAGAVSVPASATANISATGGPAVDVTGTSGATLAFDAVSSTNSAGDGINLAGLGAGTFSAASGAIGGAAGIAFDLEGGSGAISYPGALNNGAGAAAEITGRSGGAVTLSGAIADTSDAGGGISLSGNTGGSSTFSNASKVLNTGAGTAVAMGTSDGHTLTLSGGGLDIDATSGAGIDATTSGTLIVTGAGNTIATTTGRALHVSATDIGTGGLTFQSIATNGAASGITLNTTGATAGLTVTGNGGTCSSAATCTGGAIQSSTGAGIDLTSVGGGVSLTRMSVNNGGDDGIRGASVGGLSLANSVVLNNGNAVGERGIDMTQLSGSGGLSATTVSGSSESNVRIENDTSSLTGFDVTGSTIANTNITTGDDGFLVLNTGSAAMTVSVTGSTFTDNKGDHFQAATDADATGSLAVTFSNNTLTTTPANDPNVIGGGITVSPSGSADLTFAINDNNVQQAFDEGINLNLGTAATAAASMIGTISGNTVGNAGEVDSGSESGTGINVTSNGAGTTTVSVTGNQVRQYANPYGILLNHKEGSSTMNATVTGNTVANPGTFALNGLRVDSGATATDTGTMCAAVTGNTLTGSGLATDDVRLRQRFGTTIRLPGYAGAADDTTAVSNFVAANNPGATVSAAHNFGGGGGGFVGGAACATP